MNNNTVIKDADTITITRKEYEDLLKAKRNLDYVLMLAESDKQMREGKIITKTWEELEAMANG
jgi:antitoxin YefM